MFKKNNNNKKKEFVFEIKSDRKTNLNQFLAKYLPEYAMCPRTFCHFDKGG